MSTKRKESASERYSIVRISLAHEVDLGAYPIVLRDNETGLTLAGVFDSRLDDVPESVEMFDELFTDEGATREVA